MSQGKNQEINHEDLAETITPNPDLDQWKFYAQTTLNTSNRRLKNNRFYIRLLLGLLAAVGAGSKLGFVNPVGVLFAGIVGFPMCILWYLHILSYKQLNSGKYTVLKDMAEDLPYAPFKMEWDELDGGNNYQKYITHTTVEKWWPRVIGYPFAIMILYGGLQVLNLSALYWKAVTALTAFWLAYFISVWLEKPIFGKLNKKIQGPYEG